MKKYCIALACIMSVAQAGIGTMVKQWGNATTVSFDDRDGPKERSRKNYHTLTAAPDWTAAQQLQTYKGVRCAHFEVNAVDVDGQDIAATFYLATQSQKKQNTYTFKIVITQRARGSVVKVFDGSGTRIEGEIPVVAHAKETRRSPLLPWRDGMAQFYSVLVQTIEGRPYVLIVQHTRNQILEDGQFYRPAQVADILKNYATHPVLDNRPYGFMENVAHMRLLPIAYTHPSYWLPLIEPIFVAWSVEKGDVKTHARNYKNAL